MPMPVTQSLGLPVSTVSDCVMVTMGHPSPFGHGGRSVACIAGGPSGTAAWGPLPPRAAAHARTRRRSNRAVKTEWSNRVVKASGHGPLGLEGEVQGVGHKERPQRTPPHAPQTHLPHPRHPPRPRHPHPAPPAGTQQTRTCTRAFRRFSRPGAGGGAGGGGGPWRSGQIGTSVGPFVADLIKPRGRSSRSDPGG